MAEKQSPARLAQLVERLPYKEDVGGSSPSAPTIFQNNREWVVSEWFVEFSPRANRHLNFAG